MRKTVFLLAVVLVIAGCTPFKKSDPGYVLSGKVTDDQGRVVAGVKIQVSGAETQLVAETAADGTWVASPVRGSVTVRPVKEGYTFMPTQYGATNGQDGLDFDATREPPPGSEDPPPGSEDPPPGSEDPPPGSEDPPPGSEDPPPGSEDPPPEPYNPCLDPHLAEKIREYREASDWNDWAFDGLLNEAELLDHYMLQSRTPLMGTAQVPRAQARRWLHTTPTPSEFREMVDLYYDFAPIYNIRADIALAQAVLETGYFRFPSTGYVHPLMNNFAGIGVTNKPPDVLPPLRGADPSRVCFREGVHGAIFVDKATGVEAQIQHLYAYASKGGLPVGRVLLSPRFTLVTRGSAPNLEDLGGGNWASDPNYSVKIRNILNQMIATP